MMGKLIQFPGRPINPATAPRTTDGDPVTACDGNMHVFEEVPGRCQCGKRLWIDLEDDQDGEYGVKPA